MKTIEDFKTETNGVVDYYAMLDITLLEEGHPLRRLGRAFDVGEKTFVRVGEYTTDQGTKMTADEFAWYFEGYGQDMLTFDEYKMVVGENLPEEEFYE